MKQAKAKKPDKKINGKKPSAKGDTFLSHLKKAQDTINSIPAEPDDSPFGPTLQKLKDAINNNLRQPQPPKPVSTIDKGKWAVWWLTPYQATKMYDSYLDDRVTMPEYVASEVHDAAEEGLSDVILVNPVLRISELDPALRIVFDEDMIHHDNNVGILVQRSDVPELDQNPRKVGRFTDLEGRLYRSKIEGHPMHPYKNSSYLIWWLTPDQANQVLEASDAGLVVLPNYLDSWMTRQVQQNRFFGMHIHVEPGFGIDEKDINHLDIQPDTYREEDRVPNGVVIPYEDKKLAASLVGVVTDLTGETDLTMIDRQWRLKTNLSLATDPEAWDKVRDTMEEKLKVGQEKRSRFWNSDVSDVAQAATVGGLRNYDDYLIWWLTDVEASNVLKAAVNKHSTVPLYVLGELSGIAHDFCGGFVHVPIHLMNPPYQVDVDDLDSLEVESPDQENMRDGILFLKSDLENIHMVIGIFTDVRGAEQEKNHPVVTAGQNAEKYIIWWLGDAEIEILNAGIRDGSVNLPGYLSQVLKNCEYKLSFGDIIVPDNVDLPLFNMTEVIRGENAELTGIVLPREDMACINKYCGRITDVEMQVAEPTWEEFNKTPYTEEEIRAMFIGYLQDIIKYWVGVHPNDAQQAAEGAVFSTLATLDGSAMDVPGFLVIPHINQEDNDYNALYGKRPYPVAPAELVDQAVDIAGELHSAIGRPVMDVIHCKNHITKKEWRDGLATQRWAYVCEVMLRETQFVRDRFGSSHPGVVLGEVWRDLCMICLKNGALFITEDYMWAEDDYSFKWATDDEVVFDNMIKDLSGYVLRTHF